MVQFKGLTPEGLLPETARDDVLVDVDERIALKADKTELDGVARAADLTDYAKTTALESFATQEALQSKADKSELVEYAKATALDSKADKTALSGYATTTVLDSKADKTAVDAANQKASSLEIQVSGLSEDFGRTGFEELPDHLGYSFAVTDTNGRVGELALDGGGEVPDWVLSRWGTRGGWGSGAVGASVSPADAWRRTLLVDEYKRRRGHVIGTSGKPVVALRFDHGLKNFRDKIIPLLDEYSLPGHQTMNSRMLDNALNLGPTWTDCQSWWANNGVEFSNHTATHSSQEGRANAYDEIVNGLKEIQAAIPEFPIEMFCPAGGVTVGEKATFNAGKTIQAFYDTYYGQLIMQHHAGIQGYIGGSIRPLPADMDIGLTLIGYDSRKPAELNGTVDELIRQGGAIQFMLHPGEVDKGTGFITTPEVEEFFAHIAARRDAGELEVLSLSGQLLADPTSTYRHDLLAPYKWDAAFTGWTGSTGWSTTSGPDGKTWATTTTGTQLSRAIELSPYHRHFRGGMRLLTYDVVAPTGAVVETSVTGSSGVLNAVKTHTLPASNTPKTVRQHCALPLSASPTVTVKVGRVSGGAVTISNPRLITV